MYQTYRSDIGKGTLLTLFLIAGVISALLFYFVPEHPWMGIVPLSLVVVYFLFLYANTQYHLTPENRLKITAGFKKKEIDIFQISSLQPLTGYFTIPKVYALSENRIRVVYGYGDYVDISPQNSEQFMEALLQINPYIQRHQPQSARS